MTEFGVRWRRPDGTTFDAWGYTRTEAEHMVATATAPKWSPVAACVVFHEVGPAQELTEEKP